MKTVKLRRKCGEGTENYCLNERVNFCSNNINLIALHRNKINIKLLLSYVLSVLSPLPPPLNFSA